MYSLKIQVFGQFDVLDVNNHSHLPAGKKETAILAMLACTPSKRLTRKTLRDTLWSNRSDDQAKASLRQALSRTRKALRTHRDTLITDKTSVSLDQQRVVVDLDQQTTDRNNNQRAQTLLTGIEVADLAFTQWLQRCRAQHCRAAGHADRQPGSTSLDSPAISPVDYLIDAIGISTALSPSHSTDDAVLRNWLADALVNESSALGIADIRDLRTQQIMQSQQDAILTRYHLRSDAITMAKATRISARLIEAHSGKMLWHSSLQFPRGDFQKFQETTQKITTGFIDYVLQHHHESTDINQAQHKLNLYTAQCLQGILVPGSVSIDQIETRLAWLIENHPTSIHYALRALLCALKLAECHYTYQQVERERLHHDMRRALELDSSNPITQSMLGHIHAYVLGDLVNAIDLTREAIDRQPFNPICCIFHSIALHYAGKKTLSMAFAEQAWRAGSRSFIKPLLQSVSSSAHLLKGEFIQAAAFAECAHRESRTFRPVLNNLLITYTHLKQYDKAERVLQQLRDRDPDLSHRTIETGETTVKNTELREHLSVALRQYSQHW